ncbi:MAG TPA: 50S ribosomal protein L13 [Candidatus Eisenbacteria bacterium]|nr:50S ribosomal protein L13 [Candidatus Eisenbacteria bacterium]
MSTFLANKKDYTAKKWQVVDARGQVVGRLAARIARILNGKSETDYTWHVETGSGVIVINAEHVRVTGTKTKSKAKTKIYTSFSGYPGGIYRRSFETMMKKDPTFAIKHAVKGMLPKSRLGKRMITRLLVYAGAEHPHAAQKPKKMPTKEIR